VTKSIKKGKRKIKNAKNDQNNDQKILPKNSNTKIIK
jgi:hypothetical protein